MNRRGQSSMALRSNDDVKRADLVGTKTLQIDGEEYALAGYCRDA